MTISDCIGAALARLGRVYPFAVDPHEDLVRSLAFLERDIDAEIGRAHV